MMSKSAPKPPWLRKKIPAAGHNSEILATIKEGAMHTVCAEAKCPNQMESFSKGNATFLLLGPNCTRSCRFCAVAAGQPNEVDRDEPARVAQAIAQLELRYIVLTMVTRDDLSDGGAALVAETIERVHGLRPDMLVEALVGDFAGDGNAVDAVVTAGPDVLAHNVEVVRQWTHRVRDRRCSYERSLEVLARARQRSGGRPTIRTEGLALGRIRQVGGFP